MLRTLRRQFNQTRLNFPPKHEISPQANNEFPIKLIDIARLTSESLLCSVSWKSGSKSFLLLTSSNARYAAGMHAVNDGNTHIRRGGEKG